MKPLRSLLLLLFLVPLSGCWQSHELEELGYVIAIGLDKGKGGKLNVTFQLANPEVGSSIIGSPPAHEKASLVFSITANDFLSAKNTANAFTSRRITLAQTMIMIVSEELARDEEFVRIMYSTTKERELRKQVFLLISKEPAAEFIRRNKPSMETRPHKFYQLMLDRARETGLIPPADILQYLQVTEGDADLFLAMYATSKNTPRFDGYEDEYQAGEIPRKGGQSIQFVGSAVFKEGQLIGTLNGEETRIALLLNKAFGVEDVLATYPDPLNKKYRITARVKAPEGPNLRYNFSKQHPSLRVMLPLSLEILAVPSMVNYGTNLKKQEELRSYLEKRITRNMNEFVHKTQRKFKGEPFGWAAQAQVYFWTLKEYQRFNWMKTYPKMDVAVKVQVHLDEFGQQIQMPNVKLLED